MAVFTGSLLWLFDNPVDVKCCFSIFCTISVNERGDAKLLWCYFSNKICSAAVSYELLHVLFIMLNILYIGWFPSFELLCEWNPMVRLSKWAIWGAINRTYRCTCQLSCVIRESPGYDTNLPVSCMGHHISWIKSSFEFFCALVWDLAHF